jgi:hypothetical protein
VKSHTTVVIPFDERVILVNLPNYAEFSHRHSEVAQSLDAISGTQFLASAGRFDKRWLLGAGLNQREPRGVTTAVGELYAVWVSAYC